MEFLYLLQDYHVILIHKNVNAKQSWVYDLDSRLDFPCDFHTYCKLTIRDDDSVQPMFQRFVFSAWYR